MGPTKRRGLMGVSRRWLAGVALFVALVSWMIPGLAAGWLSWTGMDPVVDVGNHQLSVYVEWPSQFTCTIADIEVEVAVSKGTKAALVSESSADFGCAVLSTNTTLSRGDGKRGVVEVTTLVESGPDFPVRMHLSLDGQLVGIVEGSSNSAFSGSVNIPR